MERQTVIYRLFVVLAVMVVIGIPDLTAGLILVRSPNPDRRPLGRMLLGTDSVGLIVVLWAVVPFIRLQWRGAQERRAYNARTPHLAAAQVVSGIAFPNGSAVHLGIDDSIENGSASVPTRIAGVSLVGGFEFDLQKVKGILAEPTEVEGVPCAADKVSWYHGQPTDVGCVLARGTAVNGHDLAAGTEVTVSARLSGERWLDTATLAHKKMLFEVRWPAGTVLHGTAASPDQLAHARASPGEEVSFCTPAGQDVPVPGAVLHGKVGYTVRENGRTLQECDGNDHGDDRNGTALAGAERHSRGSQADPATPWTWNDGGAPHP